MPAVPAAAPSATREPRNTFRWAMAGVAVTAIIATTTAVVVILSRGDEGQDPAATPSLPPVTVSSAPAPQPFPTDPMLIRVDRAGDMPPERKTKVAVLIPGTDERRTLVDTGSDTLPQ